MTPLFLAFCPVDRDWPRACSEPSPFRSLFYFVKEMRTLFSLIIAFPYLRCCNVVQRLVGVINALYLALCEKGWPDRGINFGI